MAYLFWPFIGLGFLLVGRDCDRAGPQSTDCFRIAGLQNDHQIFEGVAQWSLSITGCASTLIH